MPDKYPLIGMRQGSGKEESISNIDECRIFPIFYCYILIEESDDEKYRYHLQGDAMDRE